MLRIGLGVFIILHGLVHLLYAGHSRKLFELQTGLTWPDGSWLLAKSIGEERTRFLATITYIVAALGFVVSGLAILFNLAFWPVVVIGSAVFSGLIIILFWDGTMRKLADQGGVGLLIDIGILIVTLILQSENFDL